VLYGNGIQTRMQYEAQTGLLQSHVAGAAPANSAASPQTAGLDASIINQSYQYNGIGHLTQRGDTIHATQEQFSYDELNRLTNQQLLSTASAQTVRSVAYSYNAIGNILSNSEVGQYTYATAGAGARPHALASITGQAGKLSNPQYSYDAHGNITSVTGSNGGRRTHTWTSFDNPQAMSLSYPAQSNPANVIGTTPATVPTGTASMSWLYGPEHQRIRETFAKTEVINGVTQTSARTLHILHPDNEGSLYFEREVKSTGQVENRHYLSAEKGSFLLITSNGAIQTQAQSSSTLSTPTAITSEQRYWHKDHLGSIVASTNSNLTVIERMAYDPFGKRRFTNGVYDQAGTIDAQSTNRGFTGHEHLDELDFIHMNARIYDPDIGRFLSPDPTIPYINNPQAFNRFAYAVNNPLNYIDKDGFSHGPGPNASSAAQDAVAATTPADRGAEGGDSKGSGDAKSANDPTPGQPTGAPSAPGVRPGDEVVAQAGKKTSLRSGSINQHNSQTDYEIHPVSPLFDRLDRAIPAGGGPAKAAPAPAPAKVSPAPAPAPAPKTQGGAYGKLSTSPTTERHHMPANSVSPLSRDRGPAIQMEKTDHQKTGSYGSSSVAAAYREESKALIDAGKMRDAMAKEILDVKNVTGSKYNEAIQQMLDYAKQIGILNK
jgi:RHS repeat-associated protein